MGPPRRRSEVFWPSAPAVTVLVFLLVTSDSDSQYRLSGPYARSRGVLPASPRTGGVQIASIDGVARRTARCGAPRPMSAGTSSADVDMSCSPLSIGPSGDLLGGLYVIKGLGLIST